MPVGISHEGLTQGSPLGGWILLGLCVLTWQLLDTLLCSGPSETCRPCNITPSEGFEMFGSDFASIGTEDKVSVCGFYILSHELSVPQGSLHSSDHSPRVRAAPTGP